MATNIPSFYISGDAVAARNLEYNGAPLSDVDGDGTTVNPYLGCNRAGSNSHALGVATGSISAANAAESNANYAAWTLLDQDEVARTPQNSQHIGGILDAAPEYEGVPYPSPAESGVSTVDFAQDADFNDTANLVVADTAAVDGGVADTITGAINDTGATISIGNVLWGKVPVV